MAHPSKGRASEGREGSTASLWRDIERGERRREKGSEGQREEAFTEAIS